MPTFKLTIDNFAEFDHILMHQIVTVANGLLATQYTVAMKRADTANDGPTTRHSRPTNSLTGMVRSAKCGRNGM